MKKLLDYAVVCILIVAIVFLFKMFGIDEYSGNGRVVDGDSLVVDGQKVRLYGIDAPELHQKCKTRNGAQYSCGRKSYRFLKSLVGNNSISCRLMDVDRYRRDVSICHVGDVELNLKMLQSGWAIAYLGHSFSYLRAEKSARKKKRGVWQGQFIRPSQWRAENR